MGEVYQARDARLRRDVALKVLRPSAGGDADHTERLLREARAAARLNHPNIVAVYDVGTEGGVPYVVSELLRGESLRDRLARGGLSYRKALEYGAQIAEALGIAHERGIWHRDVKPGNVFVTTDGLVKLLDFGLATRLPQPEADPDDSTDSATDAPPGRGTAGYMSPEQVLGTPLDHRSDIFALGTVLYEMFTGQRAFQRTTDVDARQAVVRTDPVDPRDVRPGLPDAVVAIVRRCLEKNREERYQSARDLAFQFRQLHQALEGSKTLPPLKALLGQPGTRRQAAIVAALAAALGAAAALLAARARREPPIVFEQLTFRRGRIGGARFAPDGQAIVYSEARPAYGEGGQRNKLEISRMDLADNPPQSLPLGYDDADVLAVSTGELAVALRRQYVGGRRFVGTLAIGPVSGQGQPRPVEEDVEDADWDPGAANLAFVKRVGAGAGTALEYPRGRVLCTSAGSIRHPRVSRDGRWIAFLEDRGGFGSGGRIAVVDVEGRMRYLTEDWQNVRGLAWSARGDEIWFAAAEGRGNRALRAVRLDGRQRLLLAPPASLTLWDVARDGRALLARDDERSALVGFLPAWNAERDLSWFDASGLADLSDDGGMVLFGDRFGIYTRKTDGSAPVNLGLRDGYADDISPDGRMALATRSAKDGLVLLPTGTGEPRAVPAFSITSYQGALWCPDGRRIVFNGVGRGGELRPYVQDVSIGTTTPPRPLGPKDTWVLAVSPDGRWAATREPTKGISLRPIDGGPPREVAGSLPEDRPVAFTSDGQALWAFHRGEIPARVFRIEIGTGRRELWRTLWPPDPAGVYSVINFKITPTGSAYFYSYAGVLSQLYLVRGLR